MPPGSRTEPVPDRPAGAGAATRGRDLVITRGSTEQTSSQSGKGKAHARHRTLVSTHQSAVLGWIQTEATRLGLQNCKCTALSVRRKGDTYDSERPRRRGKRLGALGFLGVLLECLPLRHQVPHFPHQGLMTIDDLF